MKRRHSGVRWVRFGLAGLISVLLLATAANIEVPGPSLATLIRAAKAAASPSYPLIGWLVAVGVGLLALIQSSRARGREARLLAAMGSAESTAQEATGRERARAEREHFGKELALDLQGQETLETFGTLLLERLCRRLEAKAAVFHHRDQYAGDYRLTARYAASDCPACAERYAPGEGLAGQVVLDRKPLICTGQAADWLWISSGTQVSAAMTLVIAPILSGAEVPAVLELALMRDLSPSDQEEILALLDEVLPVVALSMKILEARLRILEEFARYRAMEETQRRILESIGEGILGEDLDGRVTFVNAAALRLLGFKEEELLGQPLHALTHHHYPDGRPFPREECPAFLCMRDGLTQTVTDQLFWRLDGTPLAVEYTAAAVLRDGTSLGAVISFRDITERLETQRALEQRERQLQDSEARLRTLFETASEGIWIIGLDGRTTDLNPAMARILGRPRDGILGRNIFDFVDAANAAIFHDQIRRRQRGSTGSYQIALSRPDGTQVPCLFNASPLSDARGERIGSFTMVTDLSRSGVAGPGL